MSRDSFGLKLTRTFILIVLFLTKSLAIDEYVQDIEVFERMVQEKSLPRKTCQIWQNECVARQFSP